MLTVSASCINGLGLAHAGWKVRAYTSSSTFALLGVLNKVTSIAGNFLWLEDEPDLMSTMALVGCVASAAMYSYNRTHVRTRLSTRPQRRPDCDAS